MVFWYILLMKNLMTLFLLMTIPVLAALPPMSESMRDRNAAYVVEAEVLEVAERLVNVRYGLDKEYTITLCVREMKKGLRPFSNSHIEVTCRRTYERVPGWSGPQGQNSIPKVGQTGRFYLVGGESDLTLLKPNGWVLLEN